MGREIKGDAPPPTRHITFFVVPLPVRVIVVSLQVITLRPSWFENAYCARTSSPSFGACRSGGSTRSTTMLCGIEFTIVATSMSSGSRWFPGA